MEEVGNNRRPISIGLLLFVCLLLFIFPGCKQKLNKTNLSDYTGVWAGKNSELVQTGKYTLLFNRQGLQIKAILRKVVKIQDTLYSNFVSGYIFDAIDKSYKPVEGKNIRQSLLFKSLLKPKDGGLEVSMDSQRLSLEKIEQIKACKPYDMPKAQKGSIGKCLQHWQLGTTEHKVTSDHLHITIGTNKHLYIFQSNENMLYCRAARIRHNEKGSVFSQNIRLMFNSKSDEQTIFMFHDNLKMAQSEIQINDALFKPDACSFEKDGIYWSLISYKPDTIRLNGCSETYTYSRPLKNDKNQVEWFVYKDYEQ